MAKRRSKKPPKKIPEKRLCELIIIWGRNGTGKSTKAKELMDGILMLDDCMQYLEANTTNVPGLKDILIEYRHRMLDVFLIVHGPEQVPPKIWDHASGVIVMSTARLINPNRVKVDGVEEILAAQKRVNAQFKAAKLAMMIAIMGFMSLLRYRGGG